MDVPPRFALKVDGNRAMESAESNVSDRGESIWARDVSSLLPPRKRLLLLVINYWPLFHLVLVGIALVPPWTFWPWRILTAVALLYLLPPVLARLLCLISPIPEGRIPIGSTAYFRWWMVFNLQVVFCRLSMLEEFLRLVPGLYSLWLRLWGARIWRFTYWSAGLRLLGRSFLLTGEDVIFGAAVRINPHILVTNAAGELELIVASVVVGDRAVVGGYSLLSAGTEIAADECTKAFLISPPFSRWKNGVRLKNPTPPP